MCHLTPSFVSVSASRTQTPSVQPRRLASSTTHNLKIDFRVYLDGQLVKSSSQTSVYHDKSNESDIPDDTSGSFSLQFEIPSGHIRTSTFGENILVESRANVSA
jgi:hypothetical protein